MASSDGIPGLRMTVEVCSGLHQTQRQSSTGLQSGLQSAQQSALQMDIDRIYQLMGTAVKRVYGYYIKRPLQRFNVDNRAEKAIEKQLVIPKTAPRHEGTDRLFRQLSQNNPQLKKELTEKHEDLLKRLSGVKVVSKDREISEEELKEMEEIRDRVRSRYPQSREGTDIPIHAYIEPKHVPIGRISLLKAFDFIGKHSKNPEEFDAQTIAKQYRLDEEDVKNILEYFKPFHTEGTADHVEEDTERVLGIPKAQFQSILTALKPKSDLNKEQIEGSEEQKSDEKDSKRKSNEAINK